MTLFKLIHLHADASIDDSSDEDGESVQSAPGKLQRISNNITQLLRPNSAKSAVELEKGVASVNGSIIGHTEGVEDAPIKKMRTLQRYHSGRNEEGMVYMENHSAFASRKMAISAEQVSIFLTSGL